MIYEELFKELGLRNLISEKGEINKDFIFRTLMKTVMKKAYMMLKYNGLPDEIPERAVKLYLQSYGHFAGFVLDGRKYISWGNFAGKFDPYYFPKQYIVTNPYIEGLGSRAFDIGGNCIIVKNDDLAESLIDVVSKHVAMLTENETSMIICDILARANGIISAKDDTQHDSVMLYLKQLFNGRIMPVKSDTFTGDNLESVPFGTSHYMLTDLIEYEQYIKSCLYAELGIQLNYNMKRESLNSSETTLDREILKPYIDNMLETQNNDFKMLSDFWELETPITVEKGSIWAEIDEIRDETSEMENNTSNDEKREFDENTRDFDEKGEEDHD